MHLLNTMAIGRLSKGMVDTVGYIDPAYLFYKRATPKSGCLVLELFCWSSSLGKEHITAKRVDWVDRVGPLLEAKMGLSNVMDGAAPDPLEVECRAIRCISDIAWRCLLYTRNRRPTMGSIAKSVGRLAALCAKG